MFALHSLSCFCIICLLLYYIIQGDDEACTCEDFTDPMPRDEVDGWLDAHEKNKERFRADEWGESRYDMVFYGDDLIENLNGRALNQPIANSGKITDYFKETFTLEGDEEAIDAVALGITGDSVRPKCWFCFRVGRYI